MFVRFLHDEAGYSVYCKRSNQYSKSWWSLLISLPWNRSPRCAFLGFSPLDKWSGAQFILRVPLKPPFIKRGASEAPVEFHACWTKGITTFEIMLLSINFTIFWLHKCSVFLSLWIQICSAEPSLCPIPIQKNTLWHIGLLLPIFSTSRHLPWSGLSLLWFLGSLSWPVLPPG